MSNLKKVSGRCLCGSVSYEFEITEQVFDVCHCSICRKWSGGPGFGVTAATVPRFIGENHIQTYSSPDWAERAFCNKCGTHLFYRLKDKSFTNFQLGALDNCGDYRFSLQIFIDSKPANYSFADNTKIMTEAEVLAAFKT